MNNRAKYSVWHFVFYLTEDSLQPILELDNFLRKIAADRKLGYTCERFHTKLKGKFLPQENETTEQFMSNICGCP